MGFIKEFKDFAMKGNVMDLAVGVIIGGAFGKIISSLVDNILMPIIGMVAGDADKFAALTVGGLKVGLFIQAIIDFLIIAIVLFMIIKAMNAGKKKEAEAPAAPPEDITLLREIRDSLKK
jgi:large conductance mechanosensitive channel